MLALSAMDERTSGPATPEALPGCARRLLEDRMKLGECACCRHR